MNLYYLCEALFAEEGDHRRDIPAAILWTSVTLGVRNGQFAVGSNLRSTGHTTKTLKIDHKRGQQRVTCESQLLTFP